MSTSKAKYRFSRTNEEMRAALAERDTAMQLARELRVIFAPAEHVSFAVRMARSAQRSAFDHGRYFGLIGGAA